MPGGSSCGGMRTLQGREGPHPSANCTALAPLTRAAALMAQGSLCASMEHPSWGAGAASSLTLLLAIRYSTGECCGPGDPAVALGIQLWLSPCRCVAPCRLVPAWSGAGSPRQGLITSWKMTQTLPICTGKTCWAGESKMWRAGRRGRQLLAPGASLPGLSFPDPF